MKKSAILSDDGRYRYLLTRTWAEAPLTCLFVMLNPSTADADIDDPTIRRCIKYAQDWGYASLSVVNLFAYRATDPVAMLAADDPIGPDNDAHIAAAVAAASLIVCGWGNNAPIGRSTDVLKIVRSLGKTPKGLKFTNRGEPSHPLYLRASLKPMEFPR